MGRDPRPTLHLPIGRPNEKPSVASRRAVYVTRIWKKLVETGEGRTPRPEGTANGCTTDISGALFSFYETSADRVSVKPADSLEPNHNGIRRAASRKFGARIPAFGNNRERT